MGINSDLQELKEQMKKLNNGDKKIKKDKPFRLPFGKKVGKSQAKKNFVTVMKINENGNIDFVKRQIDNQTIMEEKIPRLSTANYILRYKNNPMIILPSWSVKPFSPAEQFEQSLNDGSNIKGYAILMDKMQKEQVNAKKQVGGIVKWIIGLALAAIIVYALLTGGG